MSGRNMSPKLEIEWSMLNVVSAHATQAGCQLEKKDKFWGKLSKLDEGIEMSRRDVFQEVVLNSHLVQTV